ncbi:MAG: nitroreductase family protein [Myxococcota bacterium]
MGATLMDSNPPDTIPYVHFDPGTSAEDAARQFYEVAKLRRTVRMFSDSPVSRETIEYVVRSATTAPSGANKQPWRFVCVSSAEMKKKIRIAVEEEERSFYAHRASERWLKDLKPYGTDPDKGFLEVAPWLVIVFKLSRGDDESQVYYANESVGIAVGMLLTAAHRAGLATVTHTPAPMNFLAKVLERPDHERPYMLIPMGYPAADANVPSAAVKRKPLEDVAIFME